MKLYARLLVIALFVIGAAYAAENGPFQATGIKIGEVTDTSAIIWTRTTQWEKPGPLDGKLPTVTYRDPKTGAKEAEQSEKGDRIPEVTMPDAKELIGAAPAAPGETRVVYRAVGATDWQDSDWGAVDLERDATRQIALHNLMPATQYEIKVEARATKDAAVASTVEGGFKTAPAAATPARVLFTVITGQNVPDKDLPEGFKIYPAMLAIKPDFFVHTGDIMYYDKLAKSAEAARWHWQWTYTLPTNVAFHRQVASYFEKDDHDTFMNDCWPSMKTNFMGDFTFAQGQRIFLDEVPMAEKTYRTYRWGKDLQIWLVEGRDFRSPNDDPDGQDKTIWGAEQKAWFKKTVSESDASFKVLITPTPIVGPDRSKKNDNLANAGFKHEGDEIRGFIASQKNLVVACGDRHWQYVSVDPATGVREYSCGPASDQHAGGWPKDEKRPEHKYLNVCGGFMAVEVTRENDAPVMIVRHYSVDGNVLNEDRVALIK